MTEFDVVELLAEDKNLIVYRKRLNVMTGSVLSTILLQQVIYWTSIQHGDFYKFKEPCAHRLYREGDSWCEELVFTRKEFDTARRRISFKVKKDQIYSGQAQLNHSNALVWYWIDLDRKTWYRLNKCLLRKAIMGLYVTLNPTIS